MAEIKATIIAIDNNDFVFFEQVLKINFRDAKLDTSLKLLLAIFRSCKSTF